MPNKPTKTEATLRTAHQQKLIIQFTRPFEQGTMCGYVMDVGRKFFVLASFGHGFELEQFSCLRIKDVRKLESPAKRAAFYATARKLRGDKFPRKPKLDLTDIVTLVRSTHPWVIAIHREKIDPTVCHIGYGLSDNKKFIEMLEIDPDAHGKPSPPTTASRKSPASTSPAPTKTPSSP
jgi:hypothetical protein